MTGNSIVHHMVFENQSFQHSESMPIYRYQITSAGTIVYNTCDWMNSFRAAGPLYYTTLVPSTNPTPTPTPFRPTNRPYPTPTPTPVEETWWQRNKWYVIIAIIIFILIVAALIYYSVNKPKAPDVVVVNPPPSSYQQFYESLAPQPIYFSQ